MCGISGLITQSPVALPALEAMSFAIRHRGPHQCGTWSDAQAGVHLAHRRLSIIDLSDLGRQPMTSACGRFVIVFNGEIYNYIELRRDLAAEGCIFRTQSDTEVLLEAYATWGARCLERFNGMFAFALYDVPRRVLFVARDRLGEKPLYYIDRPGLFAFASEVKAFRPLTALGFSLGLDSDAVEALLGHMWVPGRDRTLLRDVRRLEPGSWGEYDLGTQRWRTGSYWALRVRDEFAKLSFDEAVEAADHLLNESVRLRLRADVPVAVMLSGGLDSSLIAALASRHVADLRTYTLTFEHPATEDRFAQRVAQHIGSRHQELFVATGDMLESVKAAVPCFDDLTTLDGGLVATCALSHLASEQGVRVLLLGEGSDEVNAGYSRFLFAKAPFTWLPRLMRNAAYYHSITQYPVSRPGFWRHAREVDRVVCGVAGDPMQQLTAYDIVQQLPNHLLMKVDKATMAHGVEARLPFLDPSLVEFVYSLPSRFKHRGWLANPRAAQEKHLLRRVASRYLPADIVGRRKFGMLLPVGDVLAAHRQAIRTELLDSSDSPLRQFVSREEIVGLFKPARFPWEHSEKEWFLWKLYLFHLWATWLRSP